MRSAEPPAGRSLSLLAGIAVRALPSGPFTLWMEAATAWAFRCRPELSERLAGFSGRRLLIDVTDLRLALTVELTPSIPRIALIPRAVAAADSADAAVSATFSDLLALLEGRVDGDALFFLGRLRFRGDTETILAVRNALEDARLDVEELGAGAFGPLAPMIRPMIRATLTVCAQLDRALQASTTSAPSRRIHPERDLSARHDPWRKAAPTVGVREISR